MKRDEPKITGSRGAREKGATEAGAGRQGHRMGIGLEKLLLTIRDRLSKRQYLSESAVREALVLPVLQDLGWDIFDPERVLRECSVGGRRVDYALSSNPPRRDIFIEVKGVGLAGGADRQLFEYAFHEGIPFAILTDGQEWNFFLPGEQGNYDERRVQKLDLLEREPGEAAQLFQRYLSFSNVSTGYAIEAAKADYRSVSRRKTAARRLSDAWIALLSEPDGLLLDLLSEKTETLCGYRPDAEDVEDYVLAQIPKEQVLRSHAVQPPAIPASAIAQPKRAEQTTGAEQPLRAEPKTVSERRISYELLGKRHEARNAIEALIHILRTLSVGNPNFLQRLSQTVPSRTRNHIARTAGSRLPTSPGAFGIHNRVGEGLVSGNEYRQPREAQNHRKSVRGRRAEVWQGHQNRFAKR